MIYKLPTDKGGLASNKDLLGKVNKLSPASKSLWDDLYYNTYVVSIKQYNWILSEINAGRITAEINSQKLEYEGQIRKAENDLLKMLNEPCDVSDLDLATAKARSLSGQGSVMIRPAPGKGEPFKKARQKKVSR